MPTINNYLPIVQRGIDTSSSVLEEFICSNCSITMYIDCECGRIVFKTDGTCGISIEWSMQEASIDNKRIAELIRRISSKGCFDIQFRYYNDSSNNQLAQTIAGVYEKYFLAAKEESIKLSNRYENENCIDRPIDPPKPAPKPIIPVIRPYPRTGCC